MSTNKFTPGVWEVKISESKPAFNVIGTVLGGKYKIARCPYVTWFDKEEAEANARLIAAAPQLLEALENLLQETKRITDAFDDKHLEAAEQYAKEVLAKATGEKERVK